MLLPAGGGGAAVRGGAACALSSGRYVRHCAELVAPKPKTLHYAVISKCCLPGRRTLSLAGYWVQPWLRICSASTAVVPCRSRRMLLRHALPSGLHVSLHLLH